MKDGYLLSTVLFIISIATCLSDLEYKACWNIDFTDENMTSHEGAKAHFQIPSDKQVVEDMN